MLLAVVVDFEGGSADNDGELIVSPRRLRYDTIYTEDGGLYKNKTSVSK